MTYDGKPSKAWAKGSVPGWRKLRMQRLVLDNWQCQLKLAGCEGKATCVHHIHGAANGIIVPLDQLLSSCDRCNYSHKADNNAIDPPFSGRKLW